MPVLETFPEAADLTFVGLLISIGVYGHILLISADMIGDGAESLLDAFPNQGALIGGLLIPILGAIPDGMMILLSGMGSGPKEEIQRQLNVGVGTLAGSTIMLLTIPFAIAIFMNRRPIKGKKAKVLHESTGEGFEYTDEAKSEFRKFTEQTPYTRPLYAITANGVSYQLGSQVEEGFSTSAWIMMGSTLTYLLVQIPAFFASDAVVRDWSLVSFIMSIALLVMYCYRSATKEGKNENHARAEYKKMFEKRDLLENTRMRSNLENVLAFAQVGKSIDDVFNSIAKGKGRLSESEVQRAFKLLGLNLGDYKFGEIFCEIDLNNDQTIDLKEFRQFFVTYISEFATSSLSLDRVVEEKEGKVAEREPRLMQDVSKLLHEWITKRKDHILYLKNLKEDERLAIHQWCQQREQELREKDRSLVLQHYSEPYIDADDLTKAKRRMRLELCAIKDGKIRYDPKMRRWACTSGKIQKFTVLTFRNKHFANFFNMCLKVLDENLGKDKKSDRKLTENDVVKLSTYWQLPVILGAESDKKGEAAARAMYKEIMAKYQPESEGDMTEDTFRGYLENMVAEEPVVKHTVRKDFMHKIARGYVKGKEKKTGSGHQQTHFDEESTLKSSEKLAGYGTLSASKRGEENDEGSADVSGPIFWMLWGAFLVAVFSDPMVDMIDELSNRLSINAFYVSFIVTPIASNASEVVCSARMASRLTNTTLTVALSTLYGAAVMNSTFCMAIFAGLVYFRELEWNYSAEVIIIILVMYVLGGLGVLAENGIFTVTDATIALFMFPFSLLFVYVCQNYLGLP